MTTLAEAYVQLLPSMQGMGRNIDRELGPISDRSGRAAGKRMGTGMATGISTSVKGVLAGMAAGAGAYGLASFFTDSVQGASDLAESGNKIQAVFGPAAADIQRFASQGAKVLGQSQVAALDAAATFGVFGRAAGLTKGDLSDFSSQMVTLSTDLASFYNTSPDDAITAIGAALRGEAEPIRKYGVLLDDATLRQEALRLGLIDTTKEALTPQQKVLAAQSAILKQTKVAQGDFARTSEGLANKQRTLSGAVDDLQAKLGKALVPAVTAAVSGMADFVSGMIDGTGAGGAFADVLGAIFGFLKDNGEVLLVVGGAVLGAIVAFKAITTAVQVWAAAQAILNGALVLNPIGIVVAAIAALVAGLVIAYKKSETFRKIVSVAFDLIKIGALTLAQVGVRAFKFLLNIWFTVVGGILNGAAKAFGWVPGIGPKLQGVAQDFNRMKDDANAALDRIDRNIEVQLDSAKAEAGIGALSAELQRITGRIYVVRTRHMDERVSAPGLATGGYVSGPGTSTSDSIPAWLSDGEYVIRSAAVRRIGRAHLDALNAQGYANGGAVGPIPSGGGWQISGTLDMGHGLRGYVEGVLDRVTASAAGAY